MKKTPLILAALSAAALLAGCGGPEEEPEPLTPTASLLILTPTVSLTPGGESYVDFRVSPYETAFNYDVPGGKCDISLSSVSGAPAEFSFKIKKIEPLGGGYDDAGKYRVYLEDSFVKFTYSELCALALTDSHGRISRSNGCTVSCACDETTAKLLETGLPLVRIVTENGEEPTCDYVSPPQGCVGAGTRNHTKVPGSVMIMNKDKILYSSGDYVKDESGMTVRIRGNTSAYAAKKPYKIKLQKKADLLSRGDDSKYKDKDWLLLRYDGLKMMAGFKVNELMGMQWTPGFTFVNVMMNGDYRGLYMLTESVKRNESCRLKVGENGYVIEYDAYWWNEDVYFTNDWIYGMAYTFKYPDEDEVTQEQIAYIKDYIRKVESSLYAGTYDKYIDVPSFASWLLAHDILGNLDCAGSNIFMTKYDNTPNSVLKMANLWDFDNIYRMEGSWSNAHIWGGAYFPALLSSKNSLFKDTYVAIWDSRSSSICKSVSNYMKSFTNSDLGRAVDASIPLDNQRWRAGEVSVAKSVETATNWFNSRGSWLDNAISTLR